MKREAFEPAYPQPIATSQDSIYSTLEKDYSQAGLTVREQFAMAAMKGILSNSADRGETYVAEMAVRFADALINELNKW